MLQYVSQRFWGLRPWAFLLDPSGSFWIPYLSAIRDSQLISSAFTSENHNASDELR
jgi:hypothetical protein